MKLPCCVTAFLALLPRNFPRFVRYAFSIRFCAWICAVFLCLGSNLVQAAEVAPAPEVNNATQPAEREVAPTLQWQPVEQGLHLAEAKIPSGTGSGSVALLRIDPTRYALGLYSVTEYGCPALTPSEWARQHGLTAVINASMFLPDGKTSTGYMRNGTIANNRRINKRFGSFLVYGPLDIPKPQKPSKRAAPTLSEADQLESVTPKYHIQSDSSEQTQSAPASLVQLPDPFALLTPEAVAKRLESQPQAENASVRAPQVSDIPTAQLPTADLLDKYGDKWESLLPRYRTVVQNFRMISHDRKPLWPEEGDTFSIAAIGEDSAGHIIFIHCRPQTTVRGLSEFLLAIYPDLRATMYVEGGAQATMHLNTSGTTRSWLGRAGSSFWYSATGQWPLPNVIGIKKLNTISGMNQGEATDAN
ncbi:hypothetical protein [Oleidesulfovibrio sp.]|uniref:hypothetical protein n=1 Tax=Oleidesulfovibrio sp. TaxID=2909707 RepID=UPI003A86F1A1